MSRPSPTVTVMMDAARAAGRRLIRDFGEVENLQVSRKGPSDFVSAADQKAEEIIRESLEKARPGYGFVLEEGGEVEGLGQDPPLHRRSARRHAQLPARHSALRDLDRRLSARASCAPASSSIRCATRCSGPRRTRAPGSRTSACASPRAASSPRRSSPPASLSSASTAFEKFLDELVAVRSRSRRRAPLRLGRARSCLGRRRALRRLLGARPFALGHRRRLRSGAGSRRRDHRPQQVGSRARALSSPATPASRPSWSNASRARSRRKPPTACCGRNSGPSAGMLA